VDLTTLSPVSECKTIGVTNRLIRKQGFVCTLAPRGREVLSMALGRTPTNKYGMGGLRPNNYSRHPQVSTFRFLDPRQIYKDTVAFRGEIFSGTAVLLKKIGPEMVGQLHSDISSICYKEQPAFLRVSLQTDDLE
jgi:hypothetical protein